ncbi:hypothetical protein LWF15_28010 [Kineosporia rhizophila]|uniref:hypothetical protein n=1 Tax=Kineosporia rhizophila TaxID=84633 RepID=UPI001E436576|nr:hypothetical protein [Kineosporia rhizophila]MCE0539349.1 hypothetical protein [Kineosporia rhizophila]
MKIDPAAEDLGREAVRTAIAKDRGGFEKALEEIARAAPALRDQVLPIYSAVGRSVLRSIYSGGAPNQKQNLEMAQQIRATSPWAPLELKEIWETLEGLSSANHTPDVAPERLAATLFVVVGYLLAAYTKSSGFESFYDYLDAVLNDLVRPSS